MEGSWRWFRDVVGLPGKGLFPSPNMGKRYASKKECEKLWGKRKSNNGFRYTTHEDDALKTRIETLIRQVYQRRQTPNGDINLTFALGVLAERKGFTINWAKFAESVHRRKGSFSPLPEYKNSSSSQDGEEEDQEEKEEVDHKDKGEGVEGGKKDAPKAADKGLHEGNSTQEEDHVGDEALVPDHVAVIEQQVVEEVLVQPAPTIHGGPDAEHLQSHGQGVVSNGAPTVCIGEEQLGTELGGECLFDDKVATQDKLNTPPYKDKLVGETLFDGLVHSNVAPVAGQSSTPPIVSEGLQMPPTLATDIDDNGLIVMERAVRLKEVRLREDQVKFKRELLEFKIGQLALKRKFLELGSPVSAVEEGRAVHMGEGAKFAKSSLATQISDINGLVAKKRQTVKVRTEELEAMQTKIIDLLYKMNNAEGRLHSAKVQVAGLESIDGIDVHNFGLAELQDAILELEKICHEIGEIRFELKTKVEQHKGELSKLHHYEDCLLRLKQKTCMQMDVDQGICLTFLFIASHFS